MHLLILTHLIDDDNKRSLFRDCLLFIYQKNGINYAMRTDSRKGLTVVLSGWFPDSSGKVCFPLVFFLLLLFSSQFDARPSRCVCPMIGSLAVCLVFSSVYLHYLQLHSHHFLVNNSHEHSVFSRPLARVVRHGFLVTHKNEFHQVLVAHHSGWAWTVSWLNAYYWSISAGIVQNLGFFFFFF